MMRFFIYKIKKINKIFKLLKAYIRIRDKKYRTVYMDIDMKKGVLERVRKYFLCERKISTINVYETKKGFHLYLNYNEDVSLNEVLISMYRLRVDKSYIKRFIMRGKFALFFIRRDKKNERYKYTFKREKEKVKKKKII